MNKSSYGIQYQPLSRTIAVGRLNKDRTLFLDKHDATDNALIAVAQYVYKEYDGGVTFNDQDGTEWTVRAEKSQRKP